MKWILGSLLLWLFYYPLIWILKWPLMLLPDVRNRYLFERKNGKNLGSQSFREIRRYHADICFEFSSEGEYQQVASLIEDALKAGKKIELIFFSPSVEKAILDLARNYSTQIRYLRYPLLTFGLSRWVTAPELVLVRYDLFPELLVWGLKPGRKLKLLWMTFKKERLDGRSPSLLKGLFLRHSTKIFFASESDRDFAGKLDIKGVFYDFRMEQIRRRLEKREDKFNSVFPAWGEFKRRLHQMPKEKRLILGNAWPEDLLLLEDLPEDIMLVVVPHQLTEAIISKMTSVLHRFGREVRVLQEMHSELGPGNTFLINQKGILCELYQEFGHAYVGGGLGVSVHSILEPLVAGCEKISCGPRHYRSTEYDIADEHGRVKTVRNPLEFSEWLKVSPNLGEVHAKLVDEINRYPEFRKEVISC